MPDVFPIPIFPIPCRVSLRNLLFLLSQSGPCWPPLASPVPLSCCQTGAARGSGGLTEFRQTVYSNEIYFIKQVNQLKLHQHLNTGSWCQMELLLHRGTQWGWVRGQQDRCDPPVPPRVRSALPWVSPSVQSHPRPPGGPLGLLFLSASVSPLDGAQQNQVCHLQTPWPGTPCPGLVGKLRHRDTVNIVALLPGGSDPAPRGQRPQGKGDFPPHWPSLAAPGPDSPDTGTGAAPARGQAPGLFLVGLQGPGWWIPLATPVFPWQNRALAAWPGTGLDPQSPGRAPKPLSSHRRGQFHPSLPSPAAHRAVPGEPPPSEGLHPCGGWAQGQGSPSARPPPLLSSPGAGVTPRPEGHGLGAQSSSTATCPGQVTAPAQPQLRPPLRGSSPLPRAPRAPGGGGGAGGAGGSVQSPPPWAMTRRCRLRGVETCPGSSWIPEHFPAWNGSLTRRQMVPLSPAVGLRGHVQPVCSLISELWPLQSAEPRQVPSVPAGVTRGAAAAQRVALW